MDRTLEKVPPRASRFEQSPGPARTGKVPRRVRAKTSLVAEGEPMVWLTGGALLVCTVMVIGLLAMIAVSGLATFWPQDVVRVETMDGRLYMGEVTRAEEYSPEGFVFEGLGPEQAERARARLDEEGVGQRRLFRTGNYRLTQNHYAWVNDFLMVSEDRPDDAMVLERLEWGRFYGFPRAFVLADELPRRDESGARRSTDELREEARRRLAAFEPRHGGEPRILVEEFRHGDTALVARPADELEEAPSVVGIAEYVAGTDAALALFERYHGEVRERWQQRRDLEKYDVGEVNHEQEQARLDVRSRELELEDAVAAGASEEALERARERVAEARAEYVETEQWAQSEFDEIRARIDAINRRNDRYQLEMETAGEARSDGVETLVPLAGVVRGYTPNRLGTTGRLGLYLSRWWEFLSGEPREANSEGGVFPAIFGTVAMTLIMAIFVVPFGVLAALYLREYAKAGAIVSVVRIAVNNLAGVPSIVFGVFGLGFFCYAIGTSLDELLFRAELPNPTFGKGGLLWASLTLALLTLPVVIVATEEALAAVPNSMREGSYACGASKWQTIKRIVLPRAMPGVMTGLILAMARGAGEVAPLMLVGAVKLAPELPIDGMFPYVHAQRSFMHLGFHIFDVGFQSQNSEAAKPMVYTTTLLLIAIIFILNLVAVSLRRRLSRRFETGAV